MATNTVDLWFDFSSSYSYLTLMRVEPLAAARGIGIRWRPFLLGPIFKEHGWATSPFNVYPVKGAYMWRDMERLAAKYRIPFRKPTISPQSSLVPARVAVAASDEPWVGAFCRGVMQAEFSADRRIDDEALVTEVREGIVGGQSGRWLDAARQPDIKQRLRAQTEEAQRLGIFGAPSLVVGAELFWGNDRLEDALEYATAGHS